MLLGSWSGAPARPAEQADFLTPAERTRIEGPLARDRAHPEDAPLPARPALADSRVLALSLIYFGIVIGLYGIGFWLPQIVKALGGLAIWWSA